MAIHNKQVSAVYIWTLYNLPFYSEFSWSYKHISSLQERVKGSRKDDVPWLIFPGSYQCSLQFLDTDDWVTERASGLQKPNPIITKRSFFGGFRPHWEQLQKIGRSNTQCWICQDAGRAELKWHNSTDYAWMTFWQSATVTMCVSCNSSKLVEIRKYLLPHRDRTESDPIGILPRYMAWRNKNNGATLQWTSMMLQSAVLTVHTSVSYWQTGSQQHILHTHTMPRSKNNHVYGKFYNHHISTVYRSTIQMLIIIIIIIHREDKPSARISHQPMCWTTALTLLEWVDGWFYALTGAGPYWPYIAGFTESLYWW